FITPSHPTSPLFPYTTLFRSYRDRLALLGHDDFGGMPLHRGDEFVGGRLDNGERAVMARKHRVELEEALDRERRGFRAHGEAVRSEEHTSELQSLRHLVCRLL